MRNVLVVLVLSCIGLSCGFIVPSGIREIVADLNRSANFIQNSDSKPRNMIKTKTINNSSENIMMTSELMTSIEKKYNSSNNSLDKDLYENSHDKDTAIEERSFIYIKPRGKTPYLKNVFELIPKPNFKNKAIKSYVLTHPILDDISSRFLTENIENKFSNAHAGQSSHDEYQLKMYNLINYNIDAESKPQTAENLNKPVEYLEVIKPPLVRPVVKNNENDFVSMENSLFNFTIGRKLLTESLSSRSAVKLKDDSNIENKTTEFNYDKGLTVSDEGIDDDNLDQIIKRVLENQILERKSNHVDHNGFHFCRDCLKKAKKQTLNSRLQIESVCKCGRKRLIKVIGDDIVN